MANGNFGILVWGKETLCLTVNQSDFWDHRGGELVLETTKYRDLVQESKAHGFGSGLEKIICGKDAPELPAIRPQRVPVGRVELAFREGIVPQELTLTYATGEVRITLSDGAVLTLYAATKENAAVVSDLSGAVAEIRFHPSWEFPKARKRLESIGYAAPETLSDGFRIVCPDPADGSLTVHAKKVGTEYRIFTNDAETALETAAKESHAFWSGFWADIPRLNLPEKFWEKLYCYNVYKFAAATMPNGHAAGLQGPWIEEYQEAQWSGDYHFNVNQQMIYGAALSLGKPEHLMPLFDMIESKPFMEALRHNAKMLFDVEDALWYTHAVDDRGRQCGALSCGAVLDPACGAWTALLYYGYWKQTHDRTFLKNRAYPFIYGIMRGYEEMLDENFEIPVAVSAEYASSNEDADRAGRNPSYQLAAMHKLADILLELSAELKIEPRPIWRKVQEKLPQYATVEEFEHYTQRMESRIAIWEGQDLEHCHRHHSHLGCIYPFDSVPEHPDPEMQAVLDNSVDHWISQGEGQWSEWCYPWAWCILTRMGLSEAPKVMMEVWKSHFLNEGLCTVYLPRFRGMINHRRADILKPKDENEVMQLDGAMGFVTALIEMCAYRKGDTAYLFRGLPEEWKDASIENVPLGYGVRISASRKDGITEIRL